jgi:hypothetical protein
MPGHDSKIVLNSQLTPSKQSDMDSYVNRANLFIFGCLAVIAGASTLLSAVWLQSYRISW